MAGNRSMDVVINFTMNGGSALNEFQQIKSTISNSTNSATKDFSNLNVSAQKSGSGVKQAFSTALSGVSEKVRGISESFSGLNGVMSSLMGTIGLGSFKSLTLDMAMTRDQAKNLLAVTMQGNQTWAQAQQTAGSFIDTIKEGTSGSVVKLQQMIEAMNGIKLSTGMANSDLESLNDVIRKVGEASLLMGDDTEHATFVMKEAMAGLNGDFTVLKEQFGITAEKMKAAGWSGAADDVQGYRQALEQCLSGLGDMGQVMDTTSGKINKIKSNFSSAGLEIGNQMLPAVDMVANAFLDANENGNLLAKGILYAGGAASIFASLAPSLKPMFDTYDSIKGAVEKAKGATDTLISATETMNGITEALTIAKTAETVATDAETIAETENAVAKAADTVGTEADTAAHIGLGAAMAGAASAALSLAAALLMNPWTWVAIAIVALVAALWHLYNTNEEVRNAFNNLFNMIKGPVMDAFNSLSSAVNSFIQSLVPAVLAIIDFIKWIVLLVTDFPAAQQQFRDFVDNGVNYLVDGLSNLAGMAVDAIRGAVNGVVQAASDMVTSFMDGLKSLGGQVVSYLSNIPGMISDALSGLGANVVPGGGLTEGILALVAPLPTLMYGVFQRLAPMVMPAVQEFLNRIITSFSNIASNVLNAFLSIPGELSNFFLNAVTIIQAGLTQAQMIAGSLVTMIVQVITTRFNLMVANVRLIFSFIVNAIMTRLNQARAIAGNISNMIRNAIVTRFNTIVARVRAIFQNIANNIRQRLSNAASQARQKALEIYNNIMNKIRELPGQIGNEFGNLGNIIKDKLVQAAKNAMAGAAQIVSNFLSGLDRHSPGKVQRETDAEFSSLPGIIASKGALAVRSVASMARGMVNAWTSNMKPLTVPEVDTSNLEAMASLIVPSYDTSNMESLTVPSVQTNALLETTDNTSKLSLAGTVNDILKGTNGKGLSAQFEDIQRQIMPKIIPNIPNMTGTWNTPTNSNNNTNNTNVVNNDDHTIVYNIDKITLECNNLTQAQSRKILYDALDGLYTGGL